MTCRSSKKKASSSTVQQFGIKVPFNLEEVRIWWLTRQEKFPFQSWKMASNLKAIQSYRFSSCLWAFLKELHTPFSPVRLQTQAKHFRHKQVGALKAKTFLDGKKSEEKFCESSRLRVLSIKSSWEPKFIALGIGSLIGEDFVVKLPLLTLDWWRR